MERAINIMNYFLIFAVAICVYGGYQNEGKITLDVMLPLIIIVSILIYKRNYHPLWRNVGFFVTFLFFISLSIVPLHLEQLGNAYFGNYGFFLLVLIILLTFISARLRLSTDVLTIIWTVFFLLNFYTTIKLGEGKSFLEYFYSIDVLHHVLSNYLAILLLSIIVGIFYDTRDRNIYESV